MPSDTAGPVHYLNVEYFFRIIYETVLGARAPSLQMDLMAMLSQFWIVVTVIAFIASIGFLAALIFATLRYRQVIALDEERYATIHDAHHAEEETEHNRWKHVLSLIESSQENDWRQAIIEADIILFDALDHAGYPGASVGDKLKSVDQRRLTSLQDAWDAHKVRNDIAHQGMTFQLTDHTAYRTIQRYETVLRELGEVE